MGPLVSSVDSNVQYFKHLTYCMSPREDTCRLITAGRATPSAESLLHDA